MTLKKFNELLERAKTYIFNKVNDDPRELEDAKDYFTGYFMASLFREIFKSKDDFFDEKANKAFDAWSKIDHEIRTLRYKKDYSDIIKEFLNRR